MRFPLLSVCSHGAFSSPISQQPGTVVLRDDDVPIDTVDDFQYLGSTVSNDCTSDSEISHRIIRAAQTFQSLSRLLWYQRKIRTSTKLRIFLSVVIPTLLYSLECAVVSQSQIGRLQSFVMRCLRIILRVSVQDCERNTTIRKRPRCRGCPLCSSNEDYVSLGIFSEWTTTVCLGSCLFAHCQKGAEEQEDRSCAGMTWYPKTFKSVVCLMPGETWLLIVRHGNMLLESAQPE